MMDDPKYADYPDAIYIFDGMPFRLTTRPLPIHKEPKRPVSPYAKFDKFHHKKKRK